MKRILIVCIAALITINANAQFALWHYGIIGGPSSTWLLNSNASNIGAQLNYKSSMGGGFGLTLSHNFVEKIGVKLDIIYSTHNQGYEGTLDASNGFPVGTAYTATTHLSYLDLPLLLHLGKSNGFYFEVGPQFGFLMGAKEDIAFSDASLAPLNVTGKDRKADFSSMVVSADLGFGYNISVKGLLSIDLGIRLGYSLTDATKSFPESDFNSGNDTHGFTSTYAHYNGFNLVPGNFGYAATSRITGSFLIGAILQIPSAGKH